MQMAINNTGAPRQGRLRMTTIAQGLIRNSGTLPSRGEEGEERLSLPVIGRVNAT
jgi:hypothetical protein